MANVCNTQLKIVADRISDEKADDIIKWLEDNYCLEDSLNENWRCEDSLELYCDTKWNVIPEELSKMCKKFKVQCRAIGQEDGNGFIQVVHIENNGKIIGDEAMSFIF